MDIQISEAEASRLISELKIRLQEIEEELVRTDDRHYRKDLKDSMDQLERIVANLYRGFPDLKKIA